MGVKIWLSCYFFIFIKNHLLFTIIFFLQIHVIQNPRCRTKKCYLMMYMTSGTPLESKDTDESLQVQIYWKKKCPSVILSTPISKVFCSLFC